jgi:hypothetical protein
MRVLVVANETVTGKALLNELLARHAEHQPLEVFVVCPALNSRLRLWLSDDDEAREAAERRLGESLAALRDRGIEADGMVGDAQPLQAADDALRLFQADEIVVSTHPPERSNWLEAEIPSRIAARFHQPVTHVVVDLVSEGSGDPNQSPPRSAR